MFKRVIVSLFGGSSNYTVFSEESVASPSIINVSIAQTVCTEATTTSATRQQPFRQARIRKSAQTLSVQSPVKKRKAAKNKVSRASKPLKQRHIKPHKRIVVHTHKRGKTSYVKRAIPKTVKLAAWILRFGKQQGCTMCPVCEYREILQGDHVCGHIAPECKGGPTVPSNLIPICNQCNLSMGTMNMYEFKKMYFPSSIKTPFWKKIAKQSI